MIEFYPFAFDTEVTIRDFGKYHYDIFLSSRLSHEYIIIPEKYSRYNEEEVLIFPYFYF